MRRISMCHVAMKQEQEFYSKHLYIHEYTSVRAIICVLMKDQKINLNKNHEKWYEVEPLVQFGFNSSNMKQAISLISFLD